MPNVTCAPLADIRTLEAKSLPVLSIWQPHAGALFRPRRGWQNELELWYTTGNGDFWSMNLDLRRWIPLAKGQRLLVSSLTSLQSGTVGVDLPQYLIYRMGGANSIRGYSIEELGRTLYGKDQMIGTLEYSLNLLPLRRWDIWKFALRLGLDFAVFTDAGIAWSEPQDLALRRSAKPPPHGGPAQTRDAK